MIANEFLLITNENGLPKEADHIRLNQSRSERAMGILPASGQTEQAHPREAEAQHSPSRRLCTRRYSIPRAARVDSRQALSKVEPLGMARPNILCGPTTLQTTALDSEIATNLLVVEHMQLLGGLAHLFDRYQIEIGKKSFASPAHRRIDDPLEQH
jgi:hypothetical protein